MAQLPGIPTKGVETLGRRDIGQEVSAAMAPYQALDQVNKAAFSALDHYQVLKEQKESAIIGNKTIATSKELERLTSRDFVNVNEVPPEIRQIAMSKMADDPNKLSYGDNIPTHYIGAELAEFYGNKINTDVGQIKTNRQMASYNDYTKNSVRDNMQKATANIVQVDINAGFQARRDHQDDLVNSGELSEALNSNTETFQSGYQDQQAKERQDKNLYAVARRNSEANAIQSQNDYVTAIAAGNIQAAQAAKENFRNIMADSAQHGENVFTSVERKEMTRLYDVTGDKQAYTSGLIDMLQTQGYPAVQKQLTQWGMEPTTLKNWTRKEQTNFFTNELQSLMGGLHSAHKSGINAANDSVRNAKGFFNLDQLRRRGSPIIGDKDAERASNQQYDELLGGLINSGASNEEILNFTTKYMTKDGRIPEGVTTLVDRAIASQDPEQLLLASQIAGAVNFDPRLGGIDGVLTNEKNRAYLREASTAVKHNNVGDMDVVKAIHRRYFDPESRLEANVYRNTFASELKIESMDKNFNASVKESFGSSWYQLLTSDPTASAQARVTWDWNVKNLVDGGVEYDAAVKTATENMKIRHGVTRTDKAFPQGRLMANAPDRLGDWVAPQFDQYKTQKFGEKYEHDQIYLDSDYFTDMQQVKSYPVMYRADPNDPSQDIQLVASGSPARWEPSYEKSDQYIKDQKAQDSLESTTATMVNLTRNVRAAATETLSTELDRRMEGTWPAYYPVHDDFVVKPILEDALSKLKENPDMYDTKRVGRGGKFTKQVLNQERYDAAAKEFKLAIKQARAESYEQKGINEMLSPWEKKPKAVPKEQPRKRGPFK